MSWQSIRYTAWAPIYDRVAGFGRSRGRSLGLLNIEPGERVLLIGAGTGADLPYIDAAADVTAVDVTPAMLSRLRRRAEALGRQVDARVGDAQSLEFAPNIFDAVVLHLIVAVADDGAAVVREAARVLKPGGRAVIFDKFARGRLGLLRRILNLATRALFSDINRRLGPMLEGSGLEVVHRESAAFRGQYDIVLLRKPGPGRPS
jgi:ubiquinone/menaquinone biosynthesis C-methylase UbiE